MFCLQIKDGNKIPRVRKIVNLPKLSFCISTIIAINFITVFIVGEVPMFFLFDTSKSSIVIVSPHHKTAFSRVPNELLGCIDLQTECPQNFC